MDGDHLKALIVFGAMLLSMPLSAAQLELQLGATSRTWQTEELLQLPQARTITITDDVSYKRDMQYRAVPLAALLEGIGVGPDRRLTQWFDANVPADQRIPPWSPTLSNSIK